MSGPGDAGGGNGADGVTHGMGAPGAAGPADGLRAERLAGVAAGAAGSADVVTGAKRFPADLRVPGMLHGCVLRAPSHGATLVRADTAAAAAVPGVTVVADGSFVGVAGASRGPRGGRWGWSRRSGRGPPGTSRSRSRRPGWSRGCARTRRAGAGRAGRSCMRMATRRPGWRRGRSAVGPVSRRLHRACPDGAPVGAGPLGCRQRAADGVVRHLDAVPGARRAGRGAGRCRSESVQVIVPDYGGGFGGKHGSAVALDAARLARGTGRPVHVQWTRQEEFQGSYLRPAAFIDRGRGGRAGRRADRLVGDQRQLRRGRHRAAVPDPAPAAALPAGRVAAGPGLLPGAGRHRQQLRPRVAHRRASRGGGAGPGRVPAAQPRRRAAGRGAAGGGGRDRLGRDRAGRAGRRRAAGRRDRAGDGEGRPGRHRRPGARRAGRRAAGAAAGHGGRLRRGRSTPTGWSTRSRARS